MQLGYVELEVGNALDGVKNTTCSLSTSHPIHCSSLFVHLKILKWAHIVLGTTIIKCFVHIAPTCMSVSSCHLSCCVASTKALDFYLLNFKGFHVLFKLIFLIGCLFFIRLWFGEDQRTNIIKTHVWKKLDCVFKLHWLIPHSIMKKIGRTYVSKYRINKITCTSIRITKSR